MHFLPSRCKVLLQDWRDPVSVLYLGNKRLKVSEGFVHLVSCISGNGDVGEEISAYFKNQTTFFLASSIHRINTISVSLWKVKCITLPFAPYCCMVEKRGPYESMTSLALWCLMLTAYLILPVFGGSCPSYSKAASDGFVMYWECPPNTCCYAQCLHSPNLGGRKGVEVK